MPHLSTSPLHDRFGVIVHDLDLSDVTAETHFPAIRAAFEKHSALLFKNQTLDEDTHFNLAGLFGPIEDRQADERKPGEAMKLPEVSNITKEGGVTSEADLHTLNLKSNMLWHVDSTFLPTPALVNILAAKIVTTEGGATELASTRAAFADMNPALQERLRHTWFKHRYSHSRARISPELAKLPMFNKWPDTSWRAVWQNPVTGDEAVYIASHAFGAKGMEDTEGQAFVDDVMAACTAPAYVYSHRWEVGDVLIWDQRAVLHRGTPWPYAQKRRLVSLCVSVTEADGLAQMRPAIT